MTGDRWRGTLIVAAALALALELLAAVWLLARPLALLLAAIVIADALSPPVAWLERRMPRPLAIGVVYLAALLIAAGLGLLGAPPLLDQARTLVDNGPELLERGRAFLDRFPQAREAAESRAEQLGGALVGLPLALLSALAEILLVAVLSAYWLLAAPALRRFTLSLFPAGRRGRAGATLERMGHAMGGYIRGVVIDALVVGAVVALGLLLIGVDFALVLALLAGVGEVFPIAAAVPAIAIAALDSPVKALIVLAFYVVVQQLEGYVLLPNVMRAQSDIPSLLVLFAFAAGATVGGILGALVAIPLAGALRVLVVEVVAPAIRAWSGAAAEGGGEPA